MVDDGFDNEADDEGPVPQVGDPATRRVRLLCRPCDTCVVFPGDRMHLGEERRTSFLAEALAKDSFVVCHDTVYTNEVLPAICRGFYNRHRRDSLALRLVDLYGLAREVNPP